MKNYFIPSRWAAMLFISIFFYSCSEEISENAVIDKPGSRTEGVTSLADHVFLENGYVRFASTEDFESFLGEENMEKKNLLLNRVQEAPFTSWRKYFLENEQTLAPNGRTDADDELLEDEYLASLMNEDGILQIGKYLFKIDINQALVFALAEENKSSYQDLVAANGGNEDIMIFSTTDEVLTSLEEGSTGTIENGRIQGLFCKESKADSRNDPENVYYGDDYRMVCAVDYFAAGVYFKLRAKVNNQIKNVGVWMAQQGNLRIEYFADYKPRCKDWVTKQGNHYEIDNSTKRVPYESTKALHKYTYRARFYNQASANAVSSVLEIRYGM